jgi:hypothetical protein
MVIESSADPVQTVCWAVGIMVVAVAYWVLEKELRRRNRERLDKFLDEFAEQVRQGERLLAARRAELAAQAEAARARPEAPPARPLPPTYCPPVQELLPQEPLGSDGRGVGFQEHVAADAAAAAARALLAIIAPCLREEEHRDFLEEAHGVCMTMIRAYCHVVGREPAGTRPRLTGK